MIKKAIRRFQSLSDAKKSAIAFLFASFVQRGISFIITPLFTRLLSTEDFGLVTVYNSWLEMIGTVAMLNLSSGIFNVGMMDYEKDRDGFTTSLLGLANAATIVTMAVFYGASLLFPKLIRLPRVLFLLMLLYFLFQPATRFWTARQRFEYKYKSLTVVTIISTVLSPTVGLILVLTNKENLGILRLWGTNSVLILFGIFFYLYTVRRNGKLYDREIWRYALRFSIPLIPHYLAMHILATSDRVMIQSLSGNAEAGLYGLAYTASMVICTAWTAIQGSLTPYVYEKLKKDRLDRIAPVAVPCILLFSVICLAVVIMAPEVILILGGKKYKASIPLIPPLIASVLFMEMYNLFSMVEFYHKKTVKIMLATFAAALINVVLNYFGIRKFGYTAAAYTTLFCYILYCMFHYLNMRAIEPRRIYNAKFLLIYSVAYIALCLSSLAVYPYPLVRYGIFAAIVIAAWFNRKKIMNVIRINNRPADGSGEQTPGD